MKIAVLWCIVGFFMIILGSSAIWTEEYRIKPSILKTNGELMPDLTNRSQAEAIKILEKSGIKKWRMVEVPSHAMEIIVVNQNPPAGMRIGSDGGDCVLYITTPSRKPETVTSSASGKALQKKSHSAFFIWSLFLICQVLLLYIFFKSLLSIRDSHERETFPETRIRLERMLLKTSISPAPAPSTLSGKPPEGWRLIEIRTGTSGIKKILRRFSDRFSRKAETLIPPKEKIIEQKQENDACQGMKTITEKKELTFSGFLTQDNEIQEKENYSTQIISTRCQSGDLKENRKKEDYVTTRHTASPATPVPSEHKRIGENTDKVPTLEIMLRNFLDKLRNIQ